MKLGYQLSCVYFQEPHFGLKVLWPLTIIPGDSCILRLSQESKNWCMLPVTRQPILPWLFTVLHCTLTHSSCNPVCVCVCVYTYTICMCMYSMCMCVYTYTIHVYTCIHICTYRHIYTYTHIYMYIYTCTEYIIQNKQARKYP